MSVIKVPFTLINKGSVWTLIVITAYAVPLPVPTSVAVNITPTELDAAPINIKSVDPTVIIWYVLPIKKFPAVIVALVFVLIGTGLLSVIAINDSESVDDATVNVPPPDVADIVIAGDNPAVVIVLIKYVVPDTMLVTSTLPSKIIGLFTTKLVVLSTTIKLLVAIVDATLVIYLVSAIVKVLPVGTDRI